MVHMMTYIFVIKILMGNWLQYSLLLSAKQSPNISEQILQWASVYFLVCYTHTACLYILFLSNGSVAPQCVRMWRDAGRMLAKFQIHIYSDLLVWLKDTLKLYK